jgi:hypothetical protein
MTTRKIWCLFLMACLAGFTACKKDASANTAQPVDNNLYRESVLTETREDLKTVVSGYVFNNLDWENAVITKKGGKSIIVMVKSKINNSDSLVYLSVDNMKMYKWAGEVHTIYAKSIR